MERKIVIAAGGTGGHIYPAVALAQRLVNRVDAVTFLGGYLDRNPYFQESEFLYHTVSCGAFIGKKPLRLLKSMGATAQGIWQSREYLKSFNPHLVVGFGSYHTLPVLIATRLLGIPYMLYEANSVPGRVIHLFSQQALVTGIQFPSVAKLLKGKTEQVLPPLRKGYSLDEVSLSEARDYFGLDQQRTTLLVFGGSQGAQALNNLFLRALQDFVSNGRIAIQVIHFVGNPDLVPIIQKGYEELKIPFCVKAFESQMQYAWRAANLVVARAGASTLGEMIEFEVPGILIPYPFATDDHQNKNADYMVDRVGGAIKLQEKNVSFHLLNSTLMALLAGHALPLKDMIQAIRAYKGTRESIPLWDLVEQQLSKSLFSNSTSI